MGEGRALVYLCVLWEQPCSRALTASPCPGTELRAPSVLLGCQHPTPGSGFVLLPLPFRAFPNVFQSAVEGAVSPEGCEERVLGVCRAQLGKLWEFEPCWPPHGPSQPCPCLTAESGVTMSKKTQPSPAGLEPEECF